MGLSSCWVYWRLGFGQIVKVARAFVGGLHELARGVRGVSHVHERATIGSAKISYF